MSAFAIRDAAKTSIQSSVCHRSINVAIVCEMCRHVAEMELRGQCCNYTVTQKSCTSLSPISMKPFKIKSATYWGHPVF